MVADTLNRLPKQENVVDNVEAILPFIQKEEGIFSVQLDRNKAIQVKGRSLRKRLKDSPEDFKKFKIKNVKRYSYPLYKSNPKNI